MDPRRRSGVGDGQLRSRHQHRLLGHRERKRAPGWATSSPGDDLYTSSTLAIDVATGAIKGHFQYAPNESWDWDEVSPPILVDYQRNGRTVKELESTWRATATCGSWIAVTAARSTALSRANRTSIKMFFAVSIRSRGGPMSIPNTSPEPASAPSFAPARREARTGLPSRTARRHA